MPTVILGEAAVTRSNMAIEHRRPSVLLVVMAGLLILGLVGCGDDDPAQLAARLASPTANERQDAAAALARSIDEHLRTLPPTDAPMLTPAQFEPFRPGIEQYARALQDADPVVRSAMVHCVSAFPPDQRLASGLLDIVAGESRAELRFKALAALAGYPLSDVFAGAARAACGDPHVQVRCRALSTAIAVASSPEAAVTLARKILASETSIVVKRTLVEHLRDEPRYAPLLIDACSRNDDEWLRLCALRNLGTASCPEALRYVLRVVVQLSPTCAEIGLPAATGSVATDRWAMTADEHQRLEAASLRTLERLTTRRFSHPNDVANCAKFYEALLW